MGLDITFCKVKRKDLKYYRKVNFLVSFFEQEGMDVSSQSPFQINKHQVEDLLDRCNKILEDHTKAEELLPTMSGFFFGNTDYDDSYFDSVQDVRDFINETLLPEFESLKDDEYIYFDIWY